MSSNERRSQQQARSNAKTSYSLDRELYSQMIDDAYNNALKDIGSFRATILSIKEKLLVSEIAAERTVLIVDGFKPANFYDVIIRPEWLSNVPAPWNMSDFKLGEGQMGLQINGTIANNSVEAHPEARSVTPTGNGTMGVSLKVGDIVVCSFGEGPNNSGKYRDIRFELNSVGEDEDLILAAGGKGAFSALVGKITSTLGTLLKGLVKGAGGVVVRGPSGATIFAAGTTALPETLKWSGYANKKNKKTGKYEKVIVSGKPKRREYIGTDAGLTGEFVYNGILDDRFLGTITVERGIYDHANGGALTLQKPETFKVMKDVLPSLQLMNEAYREIYKCDLPISSVNRSWEGQVDAKSNAKTGGLKAAVPGNSPHGWAMAIDFNTGREKWQKNKKTGFKSETHIWLKENGYKYGWINPDWANNSKEWKEPWHFEYRWFNTVLKGMSAKKSWYEKKIPDQYKVSPS